MDTQLYHQAILDAAAAATGRGEIENADIRVEIDNPLCGDRVRIDLMIDGGRVLQLAHRVRGCILCEAAASVIGAEAPGKRAGDLKAVAIALRARLRSAGNMPPLRWPSLEMFAPVRAYRSRHDCVLLPFDALVRALDKANGIGT